MTIPMVVANTDKHVEQTAFDTERNNWFRFTAEQALEYGLVDKILEKR